MEEKKQLIINADDFGMSTEVNGAVLNAYKNGILTSTSLMANAPAFDDAVSLLKELQGLSIGVHLNIIEFSTLKKERKQKSLLYDKNGKFNNGFIALLIKSCNKSFLEEVEEEFRLQIETILSTVSADHIDSHVHVHAIPQIFKIVCKLAQEYGIKNIRTQLEYPYTVPDIKKYFSLKYPINWIKLLLLNFFTLINKRHMKKYNLNTNENFIGVNYTGFMDKNTVEPALKKVEKRTEMVLHPSLDKTLTRYQEYLALTDKQLIQKIKQSDIELVNFSDVIKAI